MGSAVMVKEPWAPQRLYRTKDSVGAWGGGGGGGSPWRSSSSAAAPSASTTPRRTGPPTATRSAPLPPPRPQCKKHALYHPHHNLYNNPPPPRPVHVSGMLSPPPSRTYSLIASRRPQVCCRRQLEGSLERPEPRQQASEVAACKWVPLAEFLGAGRRGLSLYRSDYIAPR
jgi:hypothetical protein